MTTTNIVDETQAEQLRNGYYYPPGCLPDDETDVVLRTVSLYHTRQRVPEHRPKPDNLLENPTAREYAFWRESKCGKDYSETYSPCPHGGVHGQMLHRAYHTGMSSLYENQLYNYSALKAQNIWSSKLREKIGSTRVNLSSSLAEYRESGKLFVKTTETLHDAWKVLRGRAGRRKLRVCSIPAAVLQYNFGVAPLVEDLYSSVESLILKLDQPLYRRISVGIEIFREGPFTYGPYDYEASGTFKERATVAVRYDPDSYLQSGFDFGNPVEWAWELIPFSFVVDWAIPIGEWLGSLDALKGVTSAVGTVTTRERSEWKFRSNVVNSIRPGHFVQESHERRVITSIPIPALPKWSPGLSYKRIVNATSLLWSMSKPCRGTK